MPLQEFMPLQPCFSAVAQPPMPLHEFKPAQPLAPDLQPPWPLHAFMPLHACLGMLLISILVPELLCEAQPEAVPSSKPPTARASTLAARAGAVSWRSFLFTFFLFVFVGDVGMGSISGWTSRLRGNRVRPTGEFRIRPLRRFRAFRDGVSGEATLPLGALGDEQGPTAPYLGLTRGPSPRRLE